MFKRILIAGLGSIGSRHRLIVSKLFPEVRVGILSSKITLESAEAVTHVPTFEAAREFSPEVAVICTPAPTHVPLALALADHGTHLLIEKPISHNRVGILELIEKCHKNKSILMVGYNLRFLKSLQEFRNHLINGIVGEVFSVRCDVGQNLESWRPYDDYRNSVSAIKDLGGGVLLELSHEIDYLRWIFGEVDWVRATLLRQGNLEIDVEDTVHLTLGFSSQTSSRPLVAQLNMDFIRHDNTRCCTVIGDKGTLRWDGIKGEVAFFPRYGKSWTTYFHDSKGLDETYLLEWINFIESIKERSSPAVQGKDGLRVIEIIEAAQESAKTGIQIPVIRSSNKAMGEI